jgi:PAS domain S-box-containing protein
MQLSMGQKLGVGFGIALITLCLASVVSYRVITSFVQEAKKMEQSWRALTALGEIHLHFLTAETEQRNYLLDGDEAELGPYHRAIDALQQAMTELSSLVGEDPHQRRRLDALAPLIATATAEFDRAIDARKNKGDGAASGEVLEARNAQLAHTIRQLLNAMKDEEKSVLKSQQAPFATTAQRMTLAVITRNSLALLFVAIAGLLIYREFLMRNRTEAELARLKHQHELTLQSVADGIQVLDSQGNTTFINPAAARILGYTVEEMIGQSMHDLLHETAGNDASHSREECPLYTPLKEGNLHQEMHEMFRRKGGSSFPAEYRSAPIREHDRIVGTVITFRDISERQAVERMKDEFVSVVSHELRTPLTSIRGALGLLTSGLIGTLPEKGQRMLEIAVNNTDRLVRLINDILDLERIQSGKVALQRQLCDLGALLTQAVDEMRGMAEKAEVELVVTLHQPLRLWADPDRIVQILTNLLSNAIKFSPTGSTVWIGATPQGKEAVVTVRDQGRGIPADKVGSIFERFQQVDASDARAKGGTGLGLAICRSIVQQHGGRIWVESRPAAGSTFSFTVPLWQEAEGASVLSDGRPLVLACDDDPSALEVVQAALEQRGYQVVTAITGQEAVARAETLQPAVILLDILMPRMNGWDIMAALKRKPETSQIPIVIFSILSPQETPLLNADFAGWVQKSSEETVLLQALKRALEERAQATRVLIVEDDSDLAKVLVALLQRHGIETMQARTGQEAIRKCEQSSPDLLVLDLLLPEGDGFMVADWLRRQDQLRHIPLVIYSAKDVDGAERQRLQLGQTEFLTKARITPEEFEHRVMALLTHLVPYPDKSLPERPPMPVRQ